MITDWVSLPYCFWSSSTWHKPCFPHPEECTIYEPREMWAVSTWAQQDKEMEWCGGKWIVPLQSLGRKHFTCRKPRNTWNPKTYSFALAGTNYHLVPPLPALSLRNHSTCIIYRIKSSAKCSAPVQMSSLLVDNTHTPFPPYVLYLVCTHVHKHVQCTLCIHTKFSEHGPFLFWQC